MQKISLHDSFIHSSFNLSKMGFNVVFALLQEIKENDERGKRYRLEKQRLIELCGLKGGSAYNRLRKTIQDLEKGGLINVAENPAINDDCVRIFSNFTNNVGSSFIEFELHEKMQKFMFALKSSQYTTIDLQQVFKFKSQYSRRIYLLLKVWKNESTQYYDIDEFRSMLGLPEKQYLNFSVLRNRVLDRAVEDLSTSDRPFTYEKDGTGKKVNRIKVSIKASNYKETGSTDALIIQMVDKVDKSYNKQYVNQPEQLKSFIRSAFADQTVKARALVETNIEKAAKEGSLLFYAENPARMYQRTMLMTLCEFSQLNTNKILARLSFDEIAETIDYCRLYNEKNKKNLLKNKIGNFATWSYGTWNGKFPGIFEKYYSPEKLAA